MKKNKKITLVIAIIVLIAAVVFAVTRFLGGGLGGIDNNPEQAVSGDSNVLVAYFSWSGHGQQMARWIADETGADLFRIVPSEAYGEDFNECADRAKNELDNGIRPELAEHIDADVMVQYDTVYLVFPVWWYDLPMPVWTFLEEYDFSGKTIIPCFSHNGSSSGANSVNRVAELAAGANVLKNKVLSISGNSVADSEKKVREWADSVFTSTDNSSELNNGVSAIEDAMSQTAEPAQKEEESEMNDLRNGTSADTVAAPDDFPKAYNYGTGKISDYSRNVMLRKMPEPVGNQTVLNTEADPDNIQVLYLWEEGNVPAKTNFTQNMTGYFDDYDFRPYVTAIPVREGVQAKGAVVLMAGGAYQFRGNYTDALPTAAALRELGFQTFIVDYRLSPYTQEEGALDVARAVRFIRKNADIYGIEPDDIAVMGFSAGGIQAGEFLMHYDEDVNGTSLDSDYVPDELDGIPAHASAAGMIYSFYGRLSVGNMDTEWLSEGNLPPTYYVYGTEDPFYNQFERQYDVISGMGIETGRIVLNGWPHGFGSDGGWVRDYAEWLENIFNNNLSDAGTMYTTQTKITDVINDPVFGDYGRLIFPVETGYYSGDTLGNLRLTWYNNIDPDTTVEIVNYMRTEAEQGNKIFYDIYTDDEKRADPDKENTGIFFFKGNPGEKFAVCNAGGAFAYVGAMQDSFPHALELSKKGYNAFALIYRPGAQTACEDLSRAIAFIFEHADELEVDTADYSLWGGSAGARMAVWVGRYGTEAFGERELPQPAAVIMQYTGLNDYSEADPPTFVTVGENDMIADWRVMKQRLEAMSRIGIPTEFHSYPGLGHGFGIGKGTVAEGWLDEAVEFWE